MKRKSMLALLLAVSMTCSMTAATGTVAFASDDAATEEAADDTEAAADDADAADTEEASDDTTEASDDDQKAADEVGALIDKIYVQLKQYESEIKQSNCKLETMFDANVNYYHELVKYILAGEQGCRELEDYIKNSLESCTDVTERETSMELLSGELLDEDALV